MNIRILHLIEGARQATGVAVIIDVFRAFTVEAWLANNGAGKIIPVGDMEIAYQYRRENPATLLIGERRGVMLPGFDYGNSPSQIQNVDFSGKTVVHTTSAGTQGIANAQKADVILTGCLANAKAIATYIQQKKYQDISLVCMGLEALQPIEEDTLCAEYIKSLLEGTTFDLKAGIENLKMTSGAKFFDKKQNEVFPEADFYLSTDADCFDFVLLVEQDNKTGLNYIRKIKVDFSC